MVGLVDGRGCELVLAATGNAVVMLVDGANAYEVTVGICNHEGTTEHVVVRFLDDVHTFRHPLLIDIVYC